MKYKNEDNINYEIIESESLYYLQNTLKKFDHIIEFNISNV